jgi:DNA (cytosine-5)-methyltransferase 1
MRHGSLFSGIGGFDLAAEWMGWENIFHCEWMPFPRQVLHYHFPNSISYEDITKTDFTIHRGNIDILTGGFPCQPYSSAGKRLGKEDERHLWPHMLRAIQEIKPTYVVGENVRGLTNWNGGVVFEEVCADLEACGYEVQPILLPACSVGAPHRRDRVWFVAYSTCSMFRTNQHGGLRCEDAEIKSQRSQRIYDAIGSNGYSGTTPNSDCIRQHECECDNEKFASQRGINALNDIDESIQNWQNFPTQSPICGGNDGLPTELDGITFSKWRQESIKGYGNAIVPQVAYEIFKVIQQLDGNTIPR